MGVFPFYFLLRKFYCCYFHCSQTFYHLHLQWLMNFCRKWVEATHPPSFPSSVQWGISLDTNDCKHTKNSSDFHVSTYVSTVVCHIPAVFERKVYVSKGACVSECVYTHGIFLYFPLLSLPQKIPSFFKGIQMRAGQDFRKTRVRNLAYHFPSITTF